jgi:hypothetical protein
MRNLGFVLLLRTVLCGIRTFVSVLTADTATGHNVLTAATATGHNVLKAETATGHNVLTATTATGHYPDPDKSNTFQHFPPISR